MKSTFTQLAPWPRQLAMLITATLAIHAFAAASEVPKTPGPEVATRNDSGQKTFMDRPFRGILLPAQELVVRSPVDATLTSIQVRVGDAVEKDQILGELDLRGLQQDHVEAEARLKKVNADLALCNSTIDQMNRAEEELDSSIDQGDTVLENLDEIDSSSTRYGRPQRRRLMRTPVREIERRRVSGALDRAKRERSRLRMERTRLEGLRRNLEELGAASRVAVKTTQKAIAQHASVSSPSDGTVSQCNVRPSEFVSAGQELLRIIQTDRIKALLWIPPALRSTVKKGQTAEVRQNGSDELWVSGKITNISALPHPRTGQYMAEVEIQNQSGRQRLQPGRHVTGRISAN